MARMPFGTASRHSVYHSSADLDAPHRVDLRPSLADAHQQHARQRGRALDARDVERHAHVGAVQPRDHLLGRRVVRRGAGRRQDDGGTDRHRRTPGAAVARSVAHLRALPPSAAARSLCGAPAAVAGWPGRSLPAECGIGTAGSSHRSGCRGCARFGAAARCRSGPRSARRRRRRVPTGAPRPRRRVHHAYMRSTIDSSATAQLGEGRDDLAGAGSEAMTGRPGGSKPSPARSTKIGLVKPSGIRPGHDRRWRTDPGRRQRDELGAGLDDEVRVLPRSTTGIDGVEARHLALRLRARPLGARPSPPASVVASNVRTRKPLRRRAPPRPGSSSSPATRMFRCTVELDGASVWPSPAMPPPPSLDGEADERPGGRHHVAGLDVVVERGDVERRRVVAGAPDVGAEVAGASTVRRCESETPVPGDERQGDEVGLVEQREPVAPHREVAGDVGAVADLQDVEVDVAEAVRVADARDARDRGCRCRAAGRWAGW